MLSGLVAALSIEEMTTPISNVDNLVQVDEDWEDVLETSSRSNLAETQMAPLSADAASLITDTISGYPTLAQAETELGRGRLRNKRAAMRKARKERAAKRRASKKARKEKAAIERARASKKAKSKN